MKIDLSLPELVRLRGLVNGELEILDEELDDKKNQADLDISRSEMLSTHEHLYQLLTKINTAIQKVPVHAS